MKKLIALLGFISLFFVCMAQNTEIDENGGIKVVLSNSSPSVTKTITAAQINNGDSVIIVPASSNGKEYERIFFTKSAGTNFTAAGTDTIAYVYVNCGGKKLAKGKLSGKWIIGAYLTGRLPLDGCMDSGSPIWIKFGADFATGTRTLTTITKGR
jgi:hypothetical protein